MLGYLFVIVCLGCIFLHADAAYGEWKEELTVTKMPSQCKSGKTYTWKGTAVREQLVEAVGIPVFVPYSLSLGAEIPQCYKQPYYNAGTFKTIKFKLQKPIHLSTKKKCWVGFTTLTQCRGKTSVSATIKAKGDPVLLAVGAGALYYQPTYKTESYFGEKKVKTSLTYYKKITVYQYYK